MTLVDSHCHLHNAEYFPGNPAEYLARAAAADVRRIVVIGTSYADSMTAQDFAAAHPGVYWTFGVHPSEFEKPYREPDFTNLAPHSSQFLIPDANQDSIPSNPGRALTPCANSQPTSPTRPLAIGEVGLDYHYGPEDYGGLPLSFQEIKERQWHLLESMLSLGLQHDLPFSFHVREAFADFFAILHNFPSVRGVIHSFTDNKQNLRRCLDYGFYIGVNGLATYSTLPRPPLERILLETDAPFLAPVPHRGERCEPAYIRDVATWLATDRTLTLPEVAEATTHNFEQLFFPPA